MPGAWTTLPIKDGAGNTKTMRVWDESGAGTGPFSFGQVLADGAGGSLAKAEDAAAASGDPGLMIYGVRRDSAASSSGTDGDISTFNFDANGKLWVHADASISGGVAGDVAHDSADSGNPVKTGFKATSSLSGLTLVANADRTDGFSGLDGVQITRPHCNLEDIVSNSTTCTSGANTSIISAQGAGVKFYLLSVVIRNGGSSNGNCIITDGSGGTTKVDIPFPASTGAIYNPPVPIPFSANTAVYADPSGSDNIIVTIVGFKSKV